MTDRLDEIRKRLEDVREHQAWHIRPNWRDIAYLLAEVERLQDAIQDEKDEQRAAAERAELAAFTTE